MERGLAMRHKPYVTYTFLVIQVLVFILMSFLGGSTNSWTLISFGARENTLIALGHQYWRLLTPIFVHIGLSHILFNSVALYYLGSMVEEMIGHFRFIVLYLLSGIMGNILSYQFSWHISAGASTALFGLFAFFVTIGKLRPESGPLRQLGSQYLALIIANILLNLFSPSVDILGHIGGIIGGILVTTFLFYGREYVPKQRWLAAVVYCVIVTFVILNHGAFNTLLH